MIAPRLSFPPLYEYEPVCKHKQPLDIREGDAAHFADLSDCIVYILPARYSEQKSIAECQIIARRKLSYRSVNSKATWLGVNNLK
jgi:hypothetical protein